ncbi:MAG: hypothetical protein HQK58_12130 [Deltaproteobacteria bacterium]|nr:hypothetical protein [Deltaproteobacteria bacterium]MBF0549243.1 hypothetical protein [Deltaproteobacteria bacterium]
MNMKKITPEFLDKLGKVLGMLGSAHDGERLAAADRANALLKSNNLTWPDILTSRTSAPYIMSATSTAGPYSNWLSKLEGIKRCWADLNGWEKNFVKNVSKQIQKGKQPSPRQKTVLDELYTKHGR